MTDLDDALRSRRTAPGRKNVTTDQPLRITTDHPDWVLALVAAVEWAEYAHPKITEGDRCLGEELAAVPAEVREAAKGWAQAKRTQIGGTDV
jgi:hypothetical protein